MSRNRPPNRRDCELRDVTYVTHQGDQIPLIIGIGRYPDGSPVEVFIDTPSQLNKTFHNLLGKDAATLISIALQHGASINELRDAMGRSEVNVMGKLVERPHTLIGTVLDAMVE